MDVGLLDVPEAMVKVHDTLAQYWKQLCNIQRKLKNPDIPTKKKGDLRRKEQEVLDRINDLNGKLSY